VTRISLATLVVCLLAASAGAAGRPPEPAAAQRVPQPAPRQTADDIRAQIAALEAPDPVARAIAACFLARMRLDAIPAIPALTRLLADAAVIDPVICTRDGAVTAQATLTTTPGFEAARALVAAGDEGINTLLAAAVSSNVVVRRHAMRGLTYLRDRRTLPIFLDAIRDADAQIRVDAARGLGRMPIRW
jgi:HEAT repeat protein